MSFLPLDLPINPNKCSYWAAFSYISVFLCDKHSIPTAYCVRGRGAHLDTKLNLPVHCRDATTVRLWLFVVRRSLIELSKKARSNLINAMPAFITPSPVSVFKKQFEIFPETPVLLLIPFVTSPKCSFVLKVPQASYPS